MTTGQAFFVVVLLTTFTATNAQRNPCQRGNCVALTKCPSLYALIQSRPVPQRSVLLLQRSQCGYEGRYPKVCCPNAPTIPSGTRIEDNKEIPSTEECGNSIVDKILGGNKTDLGEFPSLALLEYVKSDGSRDFGCGGVLINQRYVLTAAHCVKSPDIPKKYRLVSVRLGEYDISSTRDCIRQYCAPSPVNVPIESAIPHERYYQNDKAQKNDIALLRLSRPVAYSDFIQPICLPIHQNVRNKAFVDEQLVAAGWGKTKTEIASNIKLKVNLPMVGRSSCLDYYRKKGVTLGDGQVCIGGNKDQDTCKGDSGGPVMTSEVVDGNSNWYVYAVVSFGPSPCGIQGWPGVYTKVSEYLSWISDNVQP